MRIRPVPFAAFAAALSPTLAIAQVAGVPSPLTLAEALRLATERSPRLVAARSLVDAADADRQQAALRPNPAVTLESGNYPLFESPRPGFWNGQELTLRFDQEIETAGRRRLRAGVATAAVEMGRSALRDEERQVQAAVRQAYLQAALAQADQELAIDTLGEIDCIIALNRTRFEHGEISGGDLRRLELERLRFIEDRFSADLAFRNARSNILAQLNFPDLGQPFEVADRLTSPGETPGRGAPGAADARALLAQALANRPDLGAARQNEARAETTTRLQRALRTPNVTVGAGYRRDFGTDAVVFGVTIPLPVVNRNQGAIARAEAERRLASALTTERELAVALEVQQAANAVETNRARVAYLEREYLAQARAALDTVLASYRLGAADLINLLDAERAFRDTRRTYNRALYDYRTSLVQLDVAVGLPIVTR